MILLRHGTGYRWYEYSVPGNIYYGFVGLAAGFSGFEIHAGAAWAEIRDPAHQSEACCPQFCTIAASPDADDVPGFGPALQSYCFSLGCYYVNPEWLSTGFDEPGDWWNVEFGIKMFRTYGKQMSLDQFQNFLASHGHWLTPGQEREWHWAKKPGKWPYRVGYFDGPDEAKNEVPVVLLLVPK
jgi:hypothetical protein